MLTKFKAYFFIVIAFLATALAVVFRFQLLKDQAKTAESNAKLAKEDAKKAQAEIELRRKTTKRMHALEQIQQDNMERILEEERRDYFSRARKKAKKKEAKK